MNIVTFHQIVFSREWNICEQPLNSFFSIVKH